MDYLRELEVLRKKILIKTVVWILFFSIILFGSVLSLDIDFFKRIVFFVILFSIPSYLFIIKDKMKYDSIYKKNILLEIFKEIFTDIKYNPGIGLGKSLIEGTRMINTGDRYSSNDYISAKYNGINFESADVHIEEVHKDDDGTHYTTIFKGQWFIFDFNKKFKSNIQICEKSFFGARRDGFISNEFYKKVKMEDVEFNKKFKVYTENELDAFYVLTPSFMEKIKKLNNDLHGDLLFCLVDSKMHVGLNNKNDLFEPNVYKKLNLEKEKDKILKDIKIITDFVDILDLDNDLFRRRD